MRQRLLTAAVLLPIGLVILWFDPWGVSAAALLCALSAGMCWEYGGIASEAGAPLNRMERGWAALAAGTAALFGDWVGLLALGSLVPVAFKGSVDTFLKRSSCVLFGVVLFGWCFGWNGMRLHRLDGERWLLLTALTVWICDSAAYFVGRYLGKRPLAPNVSGRKTWEGFAAGFAGAAAAGWLAGAWLGAVEWKAGLGAGMIVGLVAPMSDLFASALKRSGGVKDSGALFPGHGGFLDRFDSFVFTLPALYYYWSWLSNL